MVTIFFITTLLLMVIGVPIATSIGLASIIYILIEGIEPLVIVQKLMSGVNVAALLAIPMFVLVGELMNVGGIATRLLNFANTLVGKTYGGLGIITILACMLFAAISGSSVAVAATFGSIMIPAMIKKNYDESFAGAIVATASPIGSIIPPSITLILYGVLTNTSIKDLYLAGIPAGILVGIALIIVTILISKKKGFKGGDKPFSLKEFGQATIKAFWAFGTPIILIGGVFGGWFTPTESAVIGVVYGLIVGIFIYRDMKFKNLLEIFTKSAKISAEIMVIIANAMLFAYVLTYEQIPQTIVKGLLTITDNPILILLIINLILLIAGTFMESSAIIIILVPLLLPVISTLNIDPVLFGIIVTVNTAIGMATPPLGITLYTASKVGQLKVERVSYWSLPFIFVMIAILVLITFFPEIVLFTI